MKILLKLSSQLKIRYLSLNDGKKKKGEHNKRGKHEILGSHERGEYSKGEDTMKYSKNTILKLIITIYVCTLYTYYLLYITK